MSATPQIMKIHCSVAGCNCAPCTTTRSIVSLRWKLKLCEFSTRPKPSRNMKTPTMATSSHRLSCIPGESQRDNRCSATLPSPLNIAVFHKGLQVLGAQVRREFVRKVNRAMPSAGAADPDREMRLAFAEEARHEIGD